MRRINRSITPAVERQCGEWLSMIGSSAAIVGACRARVSRRTRASVLGARLMLAKVRLERLVGPTRPTSQKIEVWQRAARPAS
jgi:hypothetical protein